MHKSDKYYIERCLDGRPDDFQYVVRRHQGALLAYLAGRLGDHGRAEEAAQESFVRAYFNLVKLKKRDSCFSWLIGIANRVVKETLRNCA